MAGTTNVHIPCLTLGVENIRMNVLDTEYLCKKYYKKTLTKLPVLFHGLRHPPPKQPKHPQAQLLRWRSPSSHSLRVSFYSVNHCVAPKNSLYGSYGTKNGKEQLPKGLGALVNIM